MVFELGLFMGALSRDRTFVVVPHGVDLKIPTDLLGMTTLRYKRTPSLTQGVEEAVGELVNRFDVQGAR